MKMDMSAKPSGEDMPKSNDGVYDQEHLEEMLESYLEAKKIEADPKLLNMLKDYAMSKSKMVEELFNAAPKTEAPKSLKDLKKKYNDKVMEEMDSEESDSSSESED